jgi:hypothetical protein
MDKGSALRACCAATLRTALVCVALLARASSAAQLVPAQLVPAQRVPAQPVSPQRAASAQPVPTAQPIPVALDPFAPGLRWQHSSSAALPWIPRDLAFAGAGELLVAAPAVANPHLVLLSAAPSGGASVLHTDDSLAAALGPLRVAAGLGAQRIHALAQLPDPDALQRRTWIVAHEPLAASTAQLAGSSAAFAPVWSRSIGLSGNGSALLASDRAGARLVVALAQPAHTLVAWLDGESGATIAQHALPAGALRRLALDGDGARVALVVGAALHVLAADGTSELALALGSATDALAMSQNGDVLACGAGSALRLWSRSAQGAWLEQAALAGQTGELCTRAALSADGSALALGWWHAPSGKRARFESWDLALGTRLHELHSGSSSASVQEFPEAVAVSEDGQRFAFGAWGGLGSEPELWLLRRGTSAPLLQADLGGSVQALALSPDGTRLAVAAKAAHANQFSVHGSVRLYDSGERDLQVLLAPRPGGSLELAARSPGASVAWFALGRPGAAVPVPGLQGALQLDLAGPALLLPALPLGSGIFGRSLPIPAAAGLIGQDLGVQAAFFTGAAVSLSSVLARPAVL